MTAIHYTQPVTAEQLASELAREATQRARFYPQRVDQARMTADDMERELAMVAAWQEDLQRVRDRRAAVAQAYGANREPAPVPAARHGLSWKQRRAGLAREIGLRARIFPRRVDEARMTRAEADHRLACLEALAAIYDDGWDWRAANGEGPILPLFARTPAEQEAAAEWHAHMTATLIARGHTATADRIEAPQEKQKELSI